MKINMKIDSYLAIAIIAIIAIGFLTIFFINLDPQELMVALSVA